MDMPADKEIMHTLHMELGIVLPEHPGEAEMRGLLAAELNRMAMEDFPRLLSILYRIDIDEVRLRERLRRESDRDAGTIMAELVLTRLAEKSRARRPASGGHEDIPEDERW